MFDPDMLCRDPDMLCRYVDRDPDMLTDMLLMTPICSVDPDMLCIAPAASPNVLIDYVDPYDPMTRG